MLYAIQDYLYLYSSNNNITFTQRSIVGVGRRLRTGWEQPLLFTSFFKILVYTPTVFFLNETQRDVTSFCVFTKMHMRRWKKLSSVKTIISFNWYNSNLFHILNVREVFEPWTLNNAVTQKINALTPKHVSSLLLVQYVRPPTNSFIPNMAK